MKPLRRLTNLLAACAVTAAAFGQPALAADLRNDPVVQDLLRRENFDPGKKFHLFGKARGTVAERTGLMTISPTITQRSGNLQMETATIFSNPGYIVRFSGHGHEVHSPFDNSASKSDSWKGGKVIDGTGMTFASMSWDGYEHHPADGYDGPQGGGYPAPHGARDIYSYVAKGQVRRQTVVHDDNRSTQQRFADRFGNIPKNFSDRAGEANKKMFEHNPGLNRWGNSMEFINGVAAGALNPFLSAGEAIGVGDAVQGTGFAIDMATAAAISAMSPDNAIAAIDHLRSLAKSEEKIGKTVRDWTAENPNAAETVEAAFNVAAAAKAAKLAKATKPGKAAVGGDFSAATQAKYKQYGDAHSANAQSALAKKLSGLESAQNSASRTKTLPDGRIRYYEAERFARTEGRTRGNSFVTEYNPKTGSTRQWMESYDHSGNVTMVHPKSVNGQSVTSQHYPPTKQELDSWKK
ncbi:MafB family polymorphic toxin [Neisseria sicca]|uniref:MafB family polymorphic toxin n=1 Tax=Neisseria sicca TaxID=490 RepID=UPI000D30B48E|nr:MafB family polymorphic toxin [Neisseria sicca]